MKIMQLATALLVCTGLSLTSQAQKVKLVEGSLDALKGQNSVALELTFDNMSVGKFDKEDDYVAEKIMVYNKKEAGKGDTWAKAWVDDREARFKPAFIELFEKYSDLSITSAKKAKYTLIFHTTATEPGYNVGVSSKPSSIDGELWLVETANKSNVLAKITIDNAKGRNFFGYDFDTGLRISEAYQLAGKALGKFIKDKM